MQNLDLAPRVRSVYMEAMESQSLKRELREFLLISFAREKRGN